MGEQTQVQTPTQSQTLQPPSSASSLSPTKLVQPNSDSLSHSLPLHNPVTDALDDSNISQKSSNPSKIPIRPQKIRKLSSNSSSTGVSATTNATSPGEGSEKKLLLQVADSASAPSSSSSPLQSSPSTTAITGITTSGTTGTLTIVASTTGGMSSNASSTPKNRRRSALQSSRILPQIIKPLTAAGEIEAALRHLRSADPLLAAFIDTYPTPTFETHRSPFLALTRSILYQQLAYKAGASIYNRFVSLCGGEDNVRPDSVLALSTQQLKQVGVSGRKASYLYDLANKYKSGILSDDTVVKMDDRSLFTMLSMVKGIGSWSVHMFMIFSLHRPDVLPVSDLGVRKGVQMLYGLDEMPRPSQMEQLCEKWKPYRSVGAWYMWRISEVKGTQNAGGAPSLEIGNVQPLQQIEPQDDPQQQHQLQLLEPINGMGNLGACIWGQ